MGALRTAEVIAAEARDLVDNVVEPVAAIIEEDNRIPDYVLEEAKARGLFGLGIPPEYGGAGLSVVGRCLVLEELGRTVNGFTTVLGAHNGVGTAGLVQLGSPELKERYLPSMATGSRIGAFALSEAQAGSDMSSLKTEAVWGGDHYVLNGRKALVTNALIADVFLVAAIIASPDATRHGINLFLIDRGTQGLVIGRANRKMGLHGSDTAGLFLKDCQVPAANLLTPGGEGRGRVLSLLTMVRPGLAARHVGSMQRLLELSVRRARSRRQYGRPIGRFQAIGHMLADTLIDVQTSRLLVTHAGRRLDNGEEATTEASMAKLYASEAYGRVADRAVQIFGAAGYMHNHPIERFYRDSRVARIVEGTSEIQRNIIAAQLMDGQSPGAMIHVADYDKT